jgi:hypothetical protein
MRSPIRISLILLAVLGSAAFAQSVGIIAGTGRAPIRAGNIRGARQEALKQAKRAALQSAIDAAVLPAESSEKKKLIEKTVLSDPDRFILSYEIGRDKAVEDAYEIAIKAKVDLDRLDKILRGPPAEKPAETEKGEALPLSIDVSGVKEYADIRRIQVAIGEIPGVKKIAMESFAAGGEVRFRVEYEGRPEDLSAAIVKIQNKDFKLREAPGPADRLIFHAVY